MGARGRRIALQAPAAAAPHADGGPRPIPPSSPAAPATIRRETYADGTTLFEAHGFQGAEGDWVRHGPWRAFHENGARHEVGAYRLGIEDGPWDWWYPGGERMGVGGFVDGERDGPWAIWYPDGAPKMTGYYARGVRCGTWTFFHPSGLRWSQGVYEAGQQTGAWSYWRADGSVDRERTGSYASGVLVGN